MCFIVSHGVARYGMYTTYVVEEVELQYQEANCFNEGMDCQETQNASPTQREKLEALGSALDGKSCWNDKRLEPLDSNKIEILCQSVYNCLKKGGYCNTLMERNGVYLYAGGSELVKEVWFCYLPGILEARRQMTWKSIVADLKPACGPEIRGKDEGCASEARF